MVKKGFSPYWNKYAQKLIKTVNLPDKQKRVYFL